MVPLAAAGSRCSRSGQEAPNAPDFEHCVCRPDRGLFYDALHDERVFEDVLPKVFVKHDPCNAVRDTVPGIEPGGRITPTAAVVAAATWQRAQELWQQHCACLWLTALCVAQPWWRLRSALQADDYVSI